MTEMSEAYIRVFRGGNYPLGALFSGDNMANPVIFTDDDALPIVIENGSHLPLNLTQSVATLYLSTTRYDIPYYDYVM
jgi:hypothetical protein